MIAAPKIHLSILNKKKKEKNSFNIQQFLTILSKIMIGVSLVQKIIFVSCQLLNANQPKLYKLELLMNLFLVLRLDKRVKVNLVKLLMNLIALMLLLIKLEILKLFIIMPMKTLYLPDPSLSFHPHANITKCFDVLNMILVKNVTLKWLIFLSLTVDKYQREPQERKPKMKLMTVYLRNHLVISLLFLKVRSQRLTVHSNFFIRALH
mmetsp:Transcript_7386/g.11007  ORF Transcript_7386/g.11007 Transcript_7386/m.11007 type:complete len:207 (+) Transcript_7386:455-1075(+)